MIYINIKIIIRQEPICKPEFGKRYFIYFSLWQVKLWRQSLKKHKGKRQRLCGCGRQSEATFGGPYQYHYLLSPLLPTLLLYISTKDSKK